MTRRERQAKRAKARRDEARAQKLCQLCSPGKRRPVRPNRSTCVECARATAKRQREGIKLQTKLGRCAKPKCPNPRTVGALCENHDKLRKTYPSHGKNVTVTTRLAKNLCQEGCGRSAFDRRRCLPCSENEAEKAQQRKAERIAAGLCYRCGKKKAPPNKGCSTCVKKRRSPGDRRKTPPPIALVRCGACGDLGHRKSARRCPRWRKT